MNNLMIIPTRDEMEVMKWQAGVLIASGFLPRHIQKPEHAIAIMLKGRELGVPPWTALTKIQIIQGTPTTAPELMLALIYKSGELADMQIDSQETACTVTMTRRGMSPITATFTMEDAEKMQLAGKDNWKKQPATMLKWRAVSACARVAFPDVIQGMYTPEEIAPDTMVNDMGEIVELPKPAKSPVLTTQDRTPVQNGKTANTPPVAPENSRSTADPRGQIKVADLPAYIQSLITPDETPVPNSMLSGQNGIGATLQRVLKDAGVALYSSSKVSLPVLSYLISREVSSTRELTLGEAQGILKYLNADQEAVLLEMASAAEYVARAEQAAETNDNGGAE